MAADDLPSDQRFTDFWTISPSEREPILREAIARTHAWHYRRNTAYRRMAETRAVGEQLDGQDLARVLRPTAQTFKSYVGVLGTAFPQDQPTAFLEWLADQLSVELPRERLGQLRRKYPSLERLLQHFEAIYADFGFEVTTSSGTSGRATIMVRDRQTVDLAVACFVQTTLTIWGVGGAHNAIFMMPRQTRIAMARTARFGAERLGMQGEGRAHFTIPFPADPDRVRIRTGRTFRPGWRGMLEKRIWHPFARWMDERRVQPRSVAQTLSLLEEAQHKGVPTLLFGSLVQLHALSQELRRRGYGIGYPFKGNGQGQGERMSLPAGSLIGTGGGLKQLYPFSPSEICRDVQAVLGLEDGQPAPIRDVMGMAEANWAAPQCEVGNYHLPPWVYVVALDDDDKILSGADVVGLLAFFDPLGGGRLFPSFFKTTDQVRLVNGGGSYDCTRCCPCGRDTPYIAEGSIRRVDLLDEAGCAGQL
jgi:hypothetical protein